MCIVYTAIYSVRRPISSPISIYDIIEKEDFGHPQLLNEFLHRKGLVHKYVPPIDNVKVEIYESRKNELDFSIKPMILQNQLDKKNRYFRPHILFPNGMSQTFNSFLKDWKQAMINMDYYYDLDLVKIPA